MQNKSVFWEEALMEREKKKKTTNSKTKKQFCK